MTPKQAIQATMDLSMLVFNSYLNDLSDEELMLRPGPGCNHLKWQLGHLIQAEVDILKLICPDTATELPDGFAEAHSKATAGSDDAAQFLSKDEYLALFQQVRATTLQALETTSLERLSEPAPERFRSFCPTVGHVFVLIGNHPMMHAGQIVPIRRQVDKPVLF